MLDVLVSGMEGCFLENTCCIPTVFIVDKNADERDGMRDAIESAGYNVVPLFSVANAVALFNNEAVCDLVILSVDSLEDKPEKFDELMKVGPPAVIVYGMDPAAKLVLHCLNGGASDFLAKPVGDDELINAVFNAIAPEREHSGKEPDAIKASSHVAGWIELTASSELEQFRRLQRFSDALFASQLPREVCDDLKMAVEEVGRNAVEWGNHFNPDKQVHVSYCLFADRIVIKVQDEGDGFTPGSLPDPTADPVKTMKDRQSAGKRPGGYGVYLLHKLVDDIVYSEKGNIVLLIKNLPTKS